MPKLIISGTAHELAEELITIGRAPDNAIVIDDPSVSSRHAQLELGGETYRLKDLESTNGTRVNGIPITETVLRFDDRIRFGGIEARFEPDTRGSQPLPQPEKIIPAPKPRARPHWRCHFWCRGRCFARFPRQRDRGADDERAGALIVDPDLDTWNYKRAN